MKHFISTLAAILVAAGIIFTIKDYNDAQERAVKARSETRQIERKIAAQRSVDETVAKIDREIEEKRKRNAAAIAPTPTPR